MKDSSSLNILSLLLTHLAQKPEVSYALFKMHEILSFLI